MLEHENIEGQIEDVLMSLAKEGVDLSPEEKKDLRGKLMEFKPGYTMCDSRGFGIKRDKNGFKVVIDNEDPNGRFKIKL